MDEKIKLVIFSLDEQSYALPVSCVVRVVRASWISALPNAPGTILGVINVHGEILPVLNLRTKLKLSEREINPHDHMILIKNDQNTFIIIVDNTFGIEEYPSKAINNAEKLINKTCGCITGIMKKEQNITFLLDPLLLFQDENKWLMEKNDQDTLSQST